MLATTDAGASPATSAGETAATTTEYRLIRIPLDQLRPYRRQARKAFNAEAMKSLADSIRSQGVVQPIVVRTSPPGPDGTACIEPFEIVAGERRWRASTMAGMRDIPALVRDDLGDTDIEVLHLIENLQRQSLELAEECDATARLVGLVGFDETCRQTGKDAAWVSRHSRLNDLPADVQALVRDGYLTSMEIGIELAALEKYSGKEFKGAVSSYRSDNAWDKPPTRASLRQTIKYAKEAWERKEKEKKEAADLKAKIAADPKLAAKLAKEKQQAKDSGAKEKEKRELCVRMKRESEQAEKQFTNDLLQLLPASFSNVKKRGELPVNVHCRSYFHYYAHGQNNFPSSINACEFSVDLKGDIETMAPALNAVSPGGTVDLELEKLTQAEARAIEKALGRKVMFTHVIDRISGKKLDAAIASGKGAVAQATKAAVGVTPGPNFSVSDFLAAGVVRDKGGKVKASDLYHAYATWCTDQGRLHEQLPFNSNEFGDAIAKAKIEKVRSNGIRYVGIKLRGG